MGEFDRGGMWFAHCFSALATARLSSWVSAKGAVKAGLSQEDPGDGAIFDAIGNPPAVRSSCLFSWGPSFGFSLAGSKKTYDTNPNEKF